MLTAADWQRLLLLEVGAGLDGQDPIEQKVLDKVTPNIDLIWTAWSDKALVHPRLQFLYAKRQALNIIEGQFRDLVSVAIGGFNPNQQQKLANLQALNKRVTDEITDLEKKAAANRPVVIAPLNATSPRMPEPGQVDPNNPVYRGDALIRPMPKDPFDWRLTTVTPT